MGLTANQESFLYWIKERWDILEKKQKGQKAPWSKDPIFQETYFTNVDREKDRVTKWIRENWVYKSRTENSYVFAMIVARVFNLPETLEAVMQPEEDIDLWLFTAEDILTQRKEQGLKIWNGAYIISTAGQKMDKLDYCMQMFEGAKDIDKKMKGVPTLRKAHKILMSVNGLASFLAAQVVADLKNTKHHRLSHAKDWSIFSAPGPGSLRGLSWFWEEKVTGKTYQEKIQDAMELIEWELPSNIYDIMCMQNLQNCFCEFDKYMRIKNGTGRSKRKYNGRK